MSNPITIKCIDNNKKSPWYKKIFTYTPKITGDVLELRMEGTKSRVIIEPIED